MSGYNGKKIFSLDVYVVSCPTWTKKSWTDSIGGEARGVHTIWRKLQSKLARGVVVALKKNILLGEAKCSNTYYKNREVKY